MSEMPGLRAFEDELHQLAAGAGRCPNFDEATESCDCIVCRTRTLLTEWEDHPLFSSLTQQSEGEGKGSGVEVALRQLVDACSGVYLDRPIPPHPEQEAANQRFESALRFARTASQGRSDGAQRNHAAIGAELAAYPEVRWDRFIAYGGKVRVYGWLDRDDGRSDFLLLDFDASSGAVVEWITSAHPHPASVVERLESDTSVECRRVEHHFDLPNAVRLDAASTQQSVPEHSGVEKAVEEALERVLRKAHYASALRDLESIQVEALAAIQPFLAQPENSGDGQTFTLYRLEGSQGWQVAGDDFKPGKRTELLQVVAVAENSGGVEEGAEPINHGSIWLDKRSGATVAVLSCCAHSHDCDHPKEPIVSGAWHKGLGLTVENFAFPEAEFRARFLRLAEDASAYDALLSSPQPQLSDEDRERGERIAVYLDSRRPACAEWLRDLLRKLASQPQQQPERERKKYRCGHCGESTFGKPVGLDSLACEHCGLLFVNAGRNVPGTVRGVTESEQHGEVEEDADRG